MASIAFHDPRLARVAGGAEQVTLLHARWLAEAGHQVTLVTRSDVTSPLLLETLRSCPSLRVVCIASPSIAPTPSFANALTPAAQRRLAQSDPLSMDAIAFNVGASEFYDTNHFDLVVISFIPDLCGIPSHMAIVLALSGLPPNTAIAKMEEPLLDRADHIVAVSAYLRDAARDRFRDALSIRRIDICLPGIAEEFFQLPLSGGKRFDLGYTGRLTKRKGIGYLVDAIAVLGDTTTCAIVGEGPMRQSLQESITQLGMTDRITMVGALPRCGVVEYIDASRVMVFPSLLPEAFGCAPLEAMARGVPVITSNLGGTSEYVREGSNAFVCAHSDARSLATCAEAILSTPSLAAALAEEGRKTASAFASSVIRSRMLGLYLSFLRNVRHE